MYFFRWQSNVENSWDMEHQSFGSSLTENDMENKGNLESLNLSTLTKPTALHHNSTIQTPSSSSTHVDDNLQELELIRQYIDKIQGICRARLEMTQLQTVRRMWMRLQRHIRGFMSGKIINEDTNSSSNIKDCQCSTSDTQSHRPLLLQKKTVNSSFYTF